MNAFFNGELLELVVRGHATPGIVEGGRVGNGEGYLERYYSHASPGLGGGVTIQ